MRCCVVTQTKLKLKFETMQQLLSLVRSLLSYSKKVLVGLWDHHAFCVSANPSPSISCWMHEPVFKKLSWIRSVARGNISAAYFINPSHHSVCLHVYASIVARQRLGKIVFSFNPLLFASCTNTFSKCCEITRGMKRSASAEELLVADSSKQLMSY
jgi:hypothetical protein